MVLAVWVWPSAQKRNDLILFLCSWWYSVVMMLVLNLWTVRVLLLKDR